MARTTRVTVTPRAEQLLRSLSREYGPLMFHQSGGCCDGSAPMCYPAGEFVTGGADVLLAEIVIDGVEQPVRFWMSARQFQRWRHTRLTIDVVSGCGSGFSVEAPGGVRFLTRSDVIPSPGISLV